MATHAAKVLYLELKRKIITISILKTSASLITSFFFIPVLDRCTYRSRLGTLLNVRSGVTFIDLSTCSRCRCRDGKAVLCEQLESRACDVINPPPGPNTDCVVRGGTLPNGESTQVSLHVVHERINNRMIMMLKIFVTHPRLIATAANVGMAS
jgi:hypothetical protein